MSIAITGGPAGAVLSGPTAAADGVATFPGLTLTRAGSYTLRASGGGLTPATIGPIAVTPAAASQLLVIAPPPGTVTAGDGFGLTASAEDTFGNTTPAFGGAVSVTGKATSGGGPMEGTTTVSPSGGVATFSGLVLDRVGTYSLQVSSPGLVPAGAGTIIVTPAAASQLVLMSQPPASVTAGAGFGFQVEAQDPYGNMATGFGGPLMAAPRRTPATPRSSGRSPRRPIRASPRSPAWRLDRAGSGYTIQVVGDGLAARRPSPSA